MHAPTTPRPILRPGSVAIAFVVALAIAFAAVGITLIRDTRATIEHRFVVGIERQNERIAQQLAGGVLLMLERLGDSADVQRPDSRGAPQFDAATLDAIDRNIRSLIAGTGIVKVKLYTRDGTTAFSTAAADIGQTKYSPAFDAALAGIISTELNRRERFTGIAGDLRDVVLAASYIPVRKSASPGAMAVLEIYSDVTSDIVEVSRGLDGHARLLTVGFVALFVLVAAMTVIAVVALRRAISGLERKSADLASSEAVFREAIESIADGLMILDDAMRLVHWNSQVETMFPHLVGRLQRGMPLPEILSLHAASPLFAVAPAQRDAWVAAFLQKLQPDHAAPPVTLTDGRIVHGVARRRPGGGHIVMTRDLTAETQARTALAAATTRAEASEARFRDFAEAASDWFWEAGPDGRLTYISAGIRRFGVEPDQLIAQRRNSLPYRVPSGQSGISQIAAATAAHVPFKDVGYEGVMSDGRHVYVAVSAVPMFDAEGTYLGHRGTGRDITDVTVSRQRLEEALKTERDAAAQQRRFIAIVAHEFRTPLTIIDGAAQRLLRNAGSLTEADLQDRVERIRRAVGRMSQLIDSTLNSARLDAGTIEIQRRPVDLVAILASAVRRHEDLSRDFTITLETSDPTITIDADPRLLDQVFTNLLSNAVKYSGDSRRIDVAARRADGSVAITVRDYGIGVAADELPNLFARFYRATTAKGLQGTGIGLNLVRELVGLHGGTVAVDSVLDRGSTFTVSLPVVARDGADPAAVAA